MKLENESTGLLLKLGMGHSTRRLRSSLDYKVMKSDHLTTTKPGKRKNPQQQQQQLTPEEERLMGRQQEAKVFKYHSSRSRGHNGPPPQRFGMSDLDSMSQEQVMHALYTDPELAQEAARVAAERAEQEAPPSAAPTPRSRRSKKAAPKEFSEHPDHLRELMDGGVPVLQWAILVVLLGAVLYQLRKILTLPDTNDQAKGRARGKAGPKKSAKKSKGPYIKVSSELPTVEEAVRAIGEDFTPPSPKKAPKKPPVAASKKKKKVKVNNGTTTAKKVQPESTSKAESSSKKEPEKTATDTAPSLVAESEDSGAGWQTVLKTRAPSEAPPAVAPVASKEPSAPAASKEPTVAAKQPVPTEKAAAPPTTKEEPQVVEAPVPVEDKKENISLDDMNGFTTAKKKKKKKSKGPSVDIEHATSTPSVPPGFTAPAYVPPGFAAASVPPGFAAAPNEVSQQAKSETDDDEALAKKLQLEEEKNAKAASGEVQNDVWEEVATRKRKGATK
jgi:hypothetical protein